MEETLQFLLSQATGGAQLRRNREQMMAHLTSDDETLQMQALFQLCDELNMASPIGLTTMQPSQLVRPIVACLKKDHNTELMLMAARALTYLGDSLPGTLGSLAEPDSVNALLDPLRNMTEIELSEQCLTCLEKLSQTHQGARAIFEAQGVGALLMFIDFFTIASQRKAWISVERACRTVNEDNFFSLVDLLPAMRQAVGHSDASIREGALNTLTIVARNVRRSAARVETIFEGLSDVFVSMTAPGEVKCDTIFTSALSLMFVGVHASASVTQSLLEGGVMRNLFVLLDTFVGADVPVSPIPESGNPTHTRSGSVSQSTSPVVEFADAPSTSFAVASDVGGSSAKRPAPSSPHPTTQQVAVIAALLADAAVRDRSGLLAYVDALGPLLHSSLASGAVALSSPTEADSRSGSDDSADDADGDDSDEEYEDVESRGEVADDHGLAARARAQNEGEASANCAALRERVANSGVPLVFKNQRVNAGFHSCDGCSKEHLEAGDWYRCNQCEDSDYCADCVQKEFRCHAGGSHTFTDVAVLLGAAPVVLRCTPPKPGAVEQAKAAMFKSNPRLLVPLLEGLQTMINLAAEAESVPTTVSACHFITSLCAQASTEQLAQCNLKESKIHEVVLAQLASNNLLANLVGVSLLSALLDKAGAEMIPKLMREGVADGLLQLRNNLVKHQTESTGDPAPEELSTSLTTVSGWKEAVARSCAQCIERFPALKDEKRSAQLQQVSTHLKNDNLVDAATLLRDVLNSGTTTFELSAGTLVADLRQALIRANTIEAVVAFMVTLSSNTPCAAPTGAACSTLPSALHILVRHLQSMQMRMDEHLKVDSSANNVESSISLRIAPHEEANGTDRRAGANRPGTTSGNVANATPKGTIASVSVDPFVTVADLADFIAQNLVRRSDPGLPGSRARQLRNRADGTDSDGVENILPDLNSTVHNAIRGKSFREAVSPTTTQLATAPAVSGAGAAATAPSAGSAAGSGMPGRYWVRCGEHVLPPSMTALQVVERFVRHVKSGARARAHLLSPAQRRQAGNEEATLFYSAEPFGSGYKIVSGAARFAALAVTTNLDVCLPSTFPGPASAAQTLKALNNKFACSKRFLTPAHQDVVAVLGMLHTALVHWSELLHYTHPQLYNTIDGGNEALLSPGVPFSEFESHKLNHKALRVSCNPRVAGLHATTWPVNVELDAPFLFPAVTREFLFSVAFSGTNRSLVHMQQWAAKHGTTDRALTSRIAHNQQRLPKSKKRVWRDHPLECALEVLGDRRGSGSVVWEFQFYNEEGSGLGPTREFYTLVSQALRKRALNLWLADDISDSTAVAGGDQVQSPADVLFAPLRGLYPRPVSEGSAEQTTLTRYFTFMGRFVARALLDGHVPMLALSPVFLKLIRGDACALSDVESLNPSLYRALRAMVDAAAQKSSTLALGKDGCSIDSLFLVFTLPGNDAIELVPGGAQQVVTAANMSEYCDRVVDFLLNQGVRYAVEAFRAGFDDYMPVSALRALALDELYLAIYGNEEPVTREELQTYCKADHGFTLTCKHVQWFFDVISSFSLKEQQQFFQFLTGSPHLPVGGLASLRPQLTIVRKVATDHSVESEQLPSAMTCQNYLKLPAYDTKELMVQKLRQAMEEGVGAFLLT